ncbi:MAG: hypothetical protein Kow0069_15750 [Promethearchaeota archaeon]
MAASRGLRRVGISNHVDPVNARWDHLKRVRKEIDDAGLRGRVLLGVELNVNEDPGNPSHSDLFLPAERWVDLDYVNVGEHVFFGGAGGFLAKCVREGDQAAVEEYFSEKAALLRDAFTRYPEQAGGNEPAFAVWVHPWLWEVQNGVMLADLTYEHTAALAEVLCDGGIAFEVNAFTFREKDLPKKPLLPRGPAAEHRLAVIRFYVDLVARLHREFPELRFATGSDAHRLDEVGELATCAEVLEKAGVQRSATVEAALDASLHPR